MPINRRTFLQTTGATATAAIACLVAPATSIAQPAPIARMPWSDFVASPARLASFRKGVQNMRSLPGHDHRSWFWQGAVHAVSDEILVDELLRNPQVATVDSEKYWNQCPHFGQASADFLLWHRAYLNVFEEILRNLSGDATLSIPYWSYEIDTQRVFPPQFAPQFTDNTRTVPNSLYHQNREIAFVGRRLSISPDVGAAADARNVKHFFNDEAQDRAGFGGSPVVIPGTDPVMGLVERRPHNDIHLAVGGVIGQTNGAMADVPTAAFDPIFWIHHSNIDRMWAEWASQTDVTWGPLPDAAWLNERPWFFRKFDGSDYNPSRLELLSRAGTNVRYPFDGPSIVELSPPAALVAGTAGATAPAVARLSADERSIELSTAGPVSRKLPQVPAGRKIRRLRLNNIEIPIAPAVGWYVYISTGPALSEQNAERLGSIKLFGTIAGAQTTHHHDQTRSQTFYVNKLLSPDAHIHFVPYSLYSTFAESTSAAKYKISGIELYG